jgi:hypothetical protein
VQNAVSFTITTSDGDETISLIQDPGTPTTIHGTFSGTAHDLVNCTASADGTKVAGEVQVFFFNDDVSVSVSDSAAAVITIAGYGVISGTYTPDARNAIIAFVLRCRLPVA